MNSRPPNLGWHRDAVAAALLFFLPLLVYWPCYQAGFIWDDGAMLTDNPEVKGGVHGLFLIWCSTRPLDYFPLTSTSFWLEWQIWGANPLGYHVTNVLLHALGAVLLWRVLRRLSIRGAWAAALIFAVHPVCVASVAWIAERKNTLSLVFYLLSLLFYLRSHTNPQPVSSPRHFPSASYFLSLLAFLLALLSKTSVVILPLVLLLCLWWLRTSPTQPLACSSTHTVVRRDWLRTAPFFALSLAFGLVTVWFQTHRAMASEVSLPLPSRILGGGVALWFYLYKTFIPVNLSMVYPQWHLNAASPLAYLPGALWLAGMTLCWRFRRTWGRPCLFGLGYFFVTLLPVLGFLKMSFHQYSQVADHFQYLALIGPIALAVAAAAAAALPSPSAGTRSSPHSSLATRHSPLLAGRIVPCLALLVTLLSVLTFRQASLYKSSSTLWRDTIARNPQAWIAYHNLALALHEAGAIEEAITDYQQALELNPHYAPAESNLGYALAVAGRQAEALAHCRKAVQLQPAFAPGHNNLGIILSQQGKPNDAIPEFRTAASLDPDYAEAYHNWGIVLAQQGQLQEALTPLSSALRLKPDYAHARISLAQVHYELGLASERERRTADALAHWRQALQLNPGWPEPLQAINALGGSTSPSSNSIVSPGVPSTPR